MRKLRATGPSGIWPIGLIADASLGSRPTGGIRWWQAAISFSQACGYLPSIEWHARVNNLLKDTVQLRPARNKMLDLLIASPKFLPLVPRCCHTRLRTYKDKTPRSSHLSNFLAPFWSVRRVTDDHAAACRLTTGLHSDDATVLHHNLLHRLVKHVRATIDSTQPKPAIDRRCQQLVEINYWLLAEC